MKKEVFILSSESRKSTVVKNTIIRMLNKYSLTLSDKLSSKTSLIICIGGDGSLLKLLNEYNFPKNKIAGVNTGSLGYFQEFNEKNLDTLFEKFIKEDYIIQEYFPLESNVYYKEKVIKKGNALTKTNKTSIKKPLNFKALNEVVIKGDHSKAVILEVYIGDSLIEKFYGDGLIVSTSAGSTAYNYALGGSILDHRLKVLQLTPIAPIKSSSYSSFTSGIVLPVSENIKIKTLKGKSNLFTISSDGIKRENYTFDNIEISISKKPINLLRFSHFDFWDKVKEKLL